MAIKESNNNAFISAHDEPRFPAYNPKEIKQLKEDSVTIEEITEEINYRDKANTYSSEEDLNDAGNKGNWESRWNDNLFRYSMAELMDIEELWCEV